MCLTSRIINLKNYSNIKLFEKRADEYKLKSKAKELFRAKFKKNNKLKSESLKKSIDNSNLSLPIFSNSTISLISELYPQFNSTKYIENSLIKIFKNESDNNKQEEQKSNNLFLTKTPLENKSFRDTFSYNHFNNKIKEKYINKCLIDNSKKTKNKIIRKNNLYYSLNSCLNNTDNTRILLEFQKEKNLIKKSPKNNIDNETSENILNNSNKASPYFEKLINRKTSLINLKRNNTKEKMEKYRELKLYNFSSQMQKDKYKISKETNLNKLEYYNDIINSLESKKNLFTNKFINKLGDYIKTINSQIEIQKAKNYFYINKIINYKNEIKQLNNKIKVINIFRKNILKWIYFQIQLKEKKITLPSYYRTILENSSSINDNNKNDNSSKEGSENKNIKFNKIGPRRFYSVHIRRSKRFLSHKKVKKNLDIPFNSENGLFYNQELDLENPLNIKEIRKIKNYKTLPIYNTLEELNEVLAFYDNKNIAQMEYYYSLRMEIFYLKKELISIKEETKKEEINHDNSILMKEKDLNEINDFISFKNNLIQKLKKSMNKQKYKKIKFKEKKDKKNISLLKNVNNLYKTCKSLGLKSNLEVNKEKIEKNKYKLIDFNEILEKLKYITYIIDYLISKFKIYNSNEYEGKELLNKLKIEIEKNHKVENTAEQRKNIYKKNIELRKTLYERNNKIYFLPNRKLDFHYNKNFSKYKQKSFVDNQNHKLNFDDLINNN